MSEHEHRSRHERKQLVGWYSAKQARHTDTIVYETPSGGRICVTEVTAGEPPDSTWDDMRCLGAVVKLVSVFKRPDMQQLTRTILE